MIWILNSLFSKNLLRKLPSGEDLRFGDIIFVDDRSPFNIAAKIIRYVESGGKLVHCSFTPNHIMMVWEPNEDLNKVTVISAQCDGIKVVPLGLWIRDPLVNIMVKRYRKPLRYAKAMHNWAITSIGAKYDFGALFEIYLRYLRMRYLKKICPVCVKNLFASKKRFTCSEHVYRTYVVGRIILWPKAGPENATPWDLFRSHRIKTILDLFSFKYPYVPRTPWDMLKGKMGEEIYTKEDSKLDRALKRKYKRKKK